MFEWTALGILFAAVAGSLFLLLQLGKGKRQHVENRLADDLTSERDSRPSLLLGELTPALAEQTPLSAEESTNLLRELRDAGYYRQTAVMEYAAVRTLLIVAPLLAAAVAAVFVDTRFIPVTAIGGIAGALLGFSLPRVYLHYRGRARTRAVERGLPVALDLITLGLSAGLTILASLRRVANELKNPYPELAQELAIVEQQAELRSLEHGLQQLADRVRIAEVRNLALILVQSERLGSDIGAALLEFSTSFRATLRQRAEAEANKASFWMAFPTVLCLWVSAAIILVGPMYFEFWHRRDELHDLFTQRLEKMRQEKERRDKRSVARPPAARADTAEEE